MARYRDFQFYDEAVLHDLTLGGASWQHTLLCASVRLSHALYAMRVQCLICWRCKRHWLRCPAFSLQTAKNCVLAMDFLKRTVL